MGIGEDLAATEEFEIEECTLDTLDVFRLLRQTRDTRLKPVEAFTKMVAVF